LYEKGFETILLLKMLYILGCLQLQLRKCSCACVSMRTSISGVGGSLEYFRKLLACHLRKFRPVAVSKDVRRRHACIDNIFIQIIADIRIHVHHLSENDNFHRLASVNTHMRARQPRIYNIFGS